MDAPTVHKELNPGEGSPGGYRPSWKRDRSDDTQKGALDLRRIPLNLVDAFSEEVLGGNPAGVVCDARGLEDWEMQRIAREVGASETAFVLERRGDDFDVRFFTPTREVDLCGHATIALFWVLAEGGYLEPLDGRRVLYQNTRAGRLQVEVIGGRYRPEMVMMTQVPPRTIAREGWSLELREILGIGEADVGGIPEPEIVSTGLPDLIVPLPDRECLWGLRPDLIVPLPDRECLWGLRPDLSALKAYCLARDISSVHCVTLDAESGFDAHCRDFSPALGIPEEAATGTASGATAAYLVSTGMIPVSRDASFLHLDLEQGRVMDRPSRIRCEVHLCSGRPVGIRVGGPARTFFGGEIQLG